MDNKLKIKNKNTSRYLKGLSLAEMDDIENAVDYALENPSGTFTRVAKENSFKLSALSKTVKSISGDTKHIRKTIDKFDKKMDDLTKAVEEGSPGGAFGGLDVPLFGKGKGAPKSRLKSKAGAPKSITPKTVSKVGAIRGMLGGIGGLLGILGILDTFDDEVLRLNESGRESSGDIRKKYGDEIVAAARKKYQPWYGASDLNVEDENDKEYVRKYLEDLNKHKIPVNKPKNSIINRISYQQQNITQQSIQQQNGIKELTPSERAMIIRQKLKGISQIPSTAGEMNFSGMETGSSPTSSASGFPGKGGGFKSDYLENNETKQPSATGGNKITSPSLPIEARALLDTISGKGLEGATYDTIVGGGKFTDYTQHPNKVGIVTNNGPSTAAGRYQITGTTWRELQKTHPDLTDFSPENQDKAAWYLAQERYSKETKGRKLNDDLKSGDPKIIDNVGRHLSGTWTSLPGGIEQGSGANKFASTYLQKRETITQTVSNTKPGEIGPTTVIQNQENVAAVRKKEIQPKLSAVLDYAAKESGVDRVEVFSGGQVALGESGPRTGSTRHDHGNAGDIYLWKDGKKVSMDTTEGQEIMKKFATASRQAGATGIGAGAGYMGSEAMHIGFGKEATWGGAPWLSEAVKKGKEMSPVNAVALMEKNKKSTGPVIASNNASIPNSLMKNKPVPTQGFLKAGNENMNTLDGDKSTDGLYQKYKDYTENQDKFPIQSKSDRLIPSRPNIPLTKSIVKPNVASITPDPGIMDSAMKSAQELAQVAIDRAKESTKIIMDYISGQKQTVTQVDNRIPKTSKNPSPLSTPPKTFHKAAKTTNPTMKTPGSDTAKTNSTPEDLYMWQRLPE